MVGQFSATHVYAFGSLVRPDRFHGGPDIDLAVEGLPAAPYFAVPDAVSRLLCGEMEFDLVPLDGMPEERAARILAAAELLAGQ